MSDSAGEDLQCLLTSDYACDLLVRRIPPGRDITFDVMGFLAFVLLAEIEELGLRVRRLLEFGCDCTELGGRIWIISKEGKESRRQWKKNIPWQGFDDTSP